MVPEVKLTLPDGSVWPQNNLSGFFDFTISKNVFVWKVRLQEKRRKQMKRVEERDRETETDRDRQRQRDRDRDRETRK